MKIYSYVVLDDSGFAPNPFWDYCTLACCKPVIRRCADKGDWIIGTGSKEVGNDKVVYVMRITEEPITFRKYYKQFKKKRPNMKSNTKSAKGDNIYKPIGKGKYKQLESMHSNGKSENKETKTHDLGQNLKNDWVLISKEFYYFGGNAIKLPANLRRYIIKEGPAHKSKFSPEQKDAFLKFVEKLKKKYRRGVNGKPHDRDEKLSKCYKPLKMRKIRCC